MKYELRKMKNLCFAKSVPVLCGVQLSVLCKMKSISCEMKVSTLQNDNNQILKFIFSCKTAKTRNKRTHWHLQILSQKKWRDSDWIILTASLQASPTVRAILLTLHWLIFPLSLPFRRLPRRLKWGSNIGLAGCGMGLKIEAGCGIQRKLEAGCGIKLSSQDRDKQFFTVGMRDVLKLMAG